MILVLLLLLTGCAVPITLDTDLCNPYLRGDCIAISEALADKLAEMITEHERR